MTKTRKVKQQPIPVRAAAKLPISPPSPQLVLGYDPNGRKEPRDVVGSKDSYSEYTLDDGCIIRTKAVLLDVKRAVDQFDDQGNPVYIMQLTMITNVRAPENLKKKIPAANKTEDSKEEKHE